MEKKYDVCCVGHMCTDILIKPVSRLPERGKLETVDSVVLKTGGCAMNTAIGLAKLGMKTAMVGKVGDDGFGDFMRVTLNEEGVFTDGLLRQPGGMTSASVVTIDEEGERTILHCLGTNQSLSYEDIDVREVLKAKYLFIGGVFLMPGFDGEGEARLLKEAQKHGVITLMDTAWDTSGRWLQTIEPCLKHLDWFMPSAEEAEQMFGTREPEELARQVKARGVQNVVIKLGEDGCYIEEKGSTGRYFEIYPSQTVDTAGAGDSWCAGFIAALARGMALDDCAKFGNAVGSMCVTAVGTTAGIRSYEETLRYLEERENEKI